MNWDKIGKMFNRLMRYIMYAFMAFCAIMLVAVSILSLYHGIDSGILTWISAPQWLWENFNTVYFLIGSITSGTLLYFFMDSLDNDEKHKKKSESEKNNTMGGLMIVIMFAFVLWPMVWSYMFAAGAHRGYKKLKKETTND